MIKTINHSTIKSLVETDAHKGRTGSLPPPDALSALPVLARIFVDAEWVEPGVNIHHNCRLFSCAGYMMGPRSALAAWANTMAQPQSSHWRVDRFHPGSDPGDAPMMQSGSARECVGLGFGGRFSTEVGADSVAALSSLASNAKLDAFTEALIFQFMAAAETASPGIIWRPILSAREENGSSRDLPSGPWPGESAPKAPSTSSCPSIFDARLMALISRSAQPDIERDALFGATPQAPSRRRSPL